jgi:O-antigen/teichoic acid export membrane protein
VKTSLLRLGKETLVYGFGDVAYRAISFFLLPVYLRHLTPSDYGTVEALTVTRALAITLINMGMPMAVFRYYHQSQDPEERRQTISTIFFLALACQLCFSGLFYFKSDSIALLVTKHPGPAMLFGILSMNIFFLSFKEIPLAFYRSRRMPWSFAGINFSVALVALVMNIYLVAYRQMGVLGVILGNLSGALLGTALVLPAVIHDVRINFSPRALKGILGFSLPLALSQLPIAVLFMADRYFILRFSTMHGLGIYALAYKFGSLVRMFVVKPVTLAYGPFIFSTHSDPAPRRTYSKAATYYAMFAAALVVCLSVFSVDAIRLMTTNPDYQEAFWLVPPIAYAFLLYGFGPFLRTGILLQGKTYLTTLACSISLGFNLLLNYVCVAKLGYQGAALALLLTLVTYVIVLYRFSERTLSIPFEGILIAKVLIASALTIALCFLGVYTSMADTLPYRLFVVVMFFAYLWVGGCLSHEEKIEIKNLLLRGFHRHPKAPGAQ